MPQSNMPDQPPQGQAAQRLVQCAKLGKELPGMPAKPFPTALGERIYAEISMQAWQQWMQHSQMLINEYSLKLSDPKAREYLQKQCEAFLFEGATAPPPGYVAPGGFVPVIKKKPE